jgi:hypothetical protein
MDDCLCTKSAKANRKYKPLSGAAEGRRIVLGTAAEGTLLICIVSVVVAARGATFSPPCLEKHEPMANYRERNPTIPTVITALPTPNGTENQTIPQKPRKTNVTESWCSPSLISNSLTNVP